MPRRVPNPHSAGASESYEPEARALFARMDVIPGEQRRSIINRYIASFKAAGIWPFVRAFYCWAAGTTLQQALLNWEGTPSRDSYLKSGTLNGVVGVPQLTPGVGISKTSTNRQIVMPVSNADVGGTNAYGLLIAFRGLASPGVGGLNVSYPDLSNGFWGSSAGYIASRTASRVAGLESTDPNTLWVLGELLSGMFTSGAGPVPPTITPKTLTGWTGQVINSGYIDAMHKAYAVTAPGLSDKQMQYFTSLVGGLVAELDVIKDIP